MWFLASFTLGPGISYGYTGPEATQPPTASWIATPDGSWAEITISGEVHDVTEGGPRQLWRIVEDAHRL